MWFPWRKKRCECENFCRHAHGGHAKRRHKNHHHHAKCHQIHLEEAQEGYHCVIMQNPDRQTYEMGLFRGAKVQVLRNDNEDNALLICTGNTRYMISKSVAKTIVVNHCTAS